MTLLTALRGLFISPSLESGAGMDGETWQRAFDFTLRCPVDKQFLVSFRYWRILMLFLPSPWVFWALRSAYWKPAWIF